MSKTVIILGNGFDLSLGLPTSYSSLVKGEQFEAEVSNGNKLACYLKEKSAKTTNWHGFEEELLNYVNERKPDADDLYDEFSSLKKAVKSYYAYVDNNCLCKPGIGSDMLINNYGSRLQTPQDELLVINFNYTSSVDRVIYESAGKIGGAMLTGLKILENLLALMYAFNGKDYRSSLNHIREAHPHGDVEHDIVLGISDYEELDEEYIFLKKSATMNFSPGFTEKDLFAANKIIIFGHSLGVPDQHYFRELFYLQSQMESGSKRFIFYYYGEKERLNLMKVLDRMTGRQLGQFQMNNNVSFIDSSTIGYKTIYKF